MISAASIAAFALTATVLSALQIFLPTPRLLLAERFLPGAGWAEILFLSLYASFITAKLLDPKQVAIWRPRIWRIFSVVFFAQLLLGIAGLENFLMTGKLHLPVPALIVAGPLYRGGGYFMLALFLATIVLVGPAWCSHLCYIGSWDDALARRRKRPSHLPPWRAPLRLGILLAVLFLAWALRFFDSIIAAYAAGAFGIVGVVWMLTWSRKSGIMTHCITWCPIGWFANVLGKINPFRVRIDSQCNQCGLCTRVCRYQALEETDLLRLRPGLTCTLCGDCLTSCPHTHIHYRFAKLSPTKARTLFIIMNVSLHAIFLGVARL